MWNLYYVQHPFANFIAVAKDLAQAQLCYGTVANITLMKDGQEQDPEMADLRVFIAH